MKTTHGGWEDVVTSVILFLPKNEGTKCEQGCALVIVPARIVSPRIRACFFGPLRVELVRVYIVTTPHIGRARTAYSGNWANDGLGFVWFLTANVRA